ncbi:PAS-domain containing protein [[Roseibacterium] beibuensis]|uniref:PAS-domain containing protein n=2 Tax=[Roseibacterium] beibuensis TaxID=1193142 RepID=A0ABP9LEM3_9RHOB|nr:PAS-domain containing protein [Roseibacterium beibuensis]
MTFPDSMTVMLFAAISLLTAAAALILTARLAPAQRGAGFAPAGMARPLIDMPHRYEFREGYLLSPVTSDDAFLPEEADRTTAFDALARVLADLHPDLPARMRALRKRGEAFLLTGTLGHDALSVAGRHEDGRVILSVGPANASDGRAAVDSATFAKLQEEADDLRTALDAATMPIWKQDGEGRIAWANASYLGLADRKLGGGDEAVALGWPLPQIFADQVAPLPDAGKTRRCSVDLPDAETPAWFEVSAQLTEDGGAICTARPIDRLIRAETSLRSFMQTLSKTFASLPTGLAVFDRRRELMTFNPALTSLSNLPMEFLSSRPTLVDFLDQLREARRMPEPRDYRGWRDEIAKLEQGASEGTYQEIWTLPDGQSLRVTGRPHPDGAVALMFEDISQEVTLTRRFRAELDLFRSVLDDEASALAVFGRDGQMVLSNAAYADLWGDDPRLTEVAPRLADATRLWQGRCAPSGIWGEIRQFAAFQIERAPWVETITLLEGERLACRVSPMAGGATLVRFLPLESGMSDPLGWSEAAASVAGAPPPLAAPHAAVAGMAEPAQAPYSPPDPKAL